VNTVIADIKTKFEALRIVEEGTGENSANNACGCLK
jgi:hypothetical protein